MSFRLVPKSVTLNDLERRNGHCTALFQPGVDFKNVQHDVGRGGCWGSCQTVCCRIHDTDQRMSVDLVEWTFYTLATMNERLYSLSIAGTHHADEPYISLEMTTAWETDWSAVSHAELSMRTYAYTTVSGHRTWSRLPPLTSCLWKEFRGFWWRWLV